MENQKFLQKGVWVVSYFFHWDRDVDCIRKPEGWNSTTHGVEQGPGSPKTQSGMRCSWIPFHWATSPPAVGKACCGSRPVLGALCPLDVPSLLSHALQDLTRSTSSSPAAYWKILPLSHSCNSSLAPPCFAPGHKSANILCRLVMLLFIPHCNASLVKGRDFVGVVHCQNAATQ